MVFQYYKPHHIWIPTIHNCNFWYHQYHCQRTWLHLHKSDLGKFTIMGWYYSPSTVVTIYYPQGGSIYADVHIINKIWSDIFYTIKQNTTNNNKPTGGMKWKVQEAIKSQCNKVLCSDTKWTLILPYWAEFKFWSVCLSYVAGKYCIK